MKADVIKKLCNGISFIEMKLIYTVSNICKS